MKTAFIILSFLGLTLFGGKDANVESKVYSFSKARTEKTDFGTVRQMIDNSTTHMENFEIHATTVNPGKMLEDNGQFMGFERMIVVKDGILNVSVDGKTREMNAGSVALLMPNNRYKIENSGKSSSTFYIVKYKSKQPVNFERARFSGGPMLLCWDSIKFTPHDKGGVRKYFDRKSAMSDRIEMHVTTLNPGIKSHEPHTHFPAEIVMMMDGKTEMEIGGKIYPGTVGDIYFLGSNIPHAIRNTGEEPCMYMAFQWQ
jgi:(S)-ureidoglycine aminohydrolase